MRTWMSLMVCAGFLSACGKQVNPLDGVRPDEYVVRARAEMQVTTDGAGRVMRSNVQQNQPVTVTLAAASSMTLDNSAFVVPTITNASMDFGRLKISALTDNNLKVCGAGGTTACGTALIRLFTTGVAGAGIFNAADNFGAPLTGALTTTPLNIGLLVANAAVTQTITIPATKKVVRLSDFTPTPSYNIKADFTNAGAGTYTTTIVVEYALAP